MQQVLLTSQEVTQEIIMCMHACCDHVTTTHIVVFFSLVASSTVDVTRASTKQRGIIIAIMHQLYLFPPSGSATQVCGLKPLNSPPEMNDLLNKVAEKTRDSWEKIGLQLQIDHGRIKSISRTQDPILCFAEVFDVWRKSGSPPYTWATIIDALRAPIVGEQQLAHELVEWLTHS